MGDQLHVIVSSVDIEQGQINFVLDKEHAENEKRLNPPKKKMQKSNRFEDEAFFEKTSKKTSYKEANDNAKNFKKKKENQRKGSSGGKPNRFEESKDKGKRRKSSGFGSEKPSLNLEKSRTHGLSFSSKDVPRPVAPMATASSPSQSSSSNGYEIKPKYSSLADYLDQKRNSKHEEKPSSKPTTKSASGSAKDRKDSAKRWPSKNDSGGVRKTRSKKSSRKNKSR
jgi:hypothetical protein